VMNMIDNRKAEAAFKTLEMNGYNYEGGELWVPPLGKPPNFDLVDVASAAIKSYQEITHRMLCITLNQYKDTLDNEIGLMTEKIIGAILKAKEVRK